MYRILSPRPILKTKNSFNLFMFPTEGDLLGDQKKIIRSVSLFGIITYRIFISSHQIM